MAYKTYTTQAIVCGSRPSNTSDCSYRLFTQRAGMLFATARSVREERSKQRYALQDFSLVRVSLVKGKSGWRIGSVEALCNPFLEARSRSERAYVTGVVSLIRRYIHGEEPLLSVYADLSAALQSETVEQVDDATLLLFEARLLFQLGHLQPNQSIIDILEEKDFATVLSNFDQDRLAELQKAIHHAHQHSQL